MACKFKFYPVGKTYTDPVTAVFKPAIPFGKKYFKGDIVLMHPEIMGSKVFLNSNILREALLNSADYLEEAIGIKITDVAKSEKVEEVVEVKPRRRTNIPKVEKVEDTIIVDEPTKEEPKKEEPVVETLGEEELIVE
jgi:hypothetical protein